MRAQRLRGRRAEGGTWRASRAHLMTTVPKAQGLCSHFASMPSLPLCKFRVRARTRLHRSAHHKPSFHPSPHRGPPSPMSPTRPQRFCHIITTFTTTFWRVLLSKVVLKDRSLMHIPVQGPATQLNSFYKIRSLEESFCLWPFASVIHLPKMQFGFCLSHLLIKYLLSEFMGDCFFSGSDLEEREEKAVLCIRPPWALGVPKAILILHIPTNDVHL